MVDFLLYIFWSAFGGFYPQNEEKIPLAQETNSQLELSIYEEKEGDSIIGDLAITGSTINEEDSLELSVAEEQAEEDKIIHMETPSRVNSLYYTAWSIGNAQKLQNLYNLAETSEVNSVIIDIKTVSGYTSFSIDDSRFGTIKPISNNLISDIKTLIKELHEKDIYVIGRIVVFKDKSLSERRPDLAIKWVEDRKTVWSDYKGNKYLDPSSKEVWDYNTNLASASYDLGFDEINFDYIRFPSDGYISKTYYPFSSKITSFTSKWGKISVIDSFSHYITTSLKEKHKDIILSADVFGLVTNVDLFQIGQNLESFLLNFDYVSPMIYPSHYSAGYLGYPVPDNIPYEIFKDSLKKSNSRVDKLNEDIKVATMSGTTLEIKGVFEPKADITNVGEIDKLKMRPWLQGFSCTRCKGATGYNRIKFREQIRAIDDSGLNSRFVWNSASNYYWEWYGY